MSSLHQFHTKSTTTTACADVTNGTAKKKVVSAVHAKAGLELTTVTCQTKVSTTTVRSWVLLKTFQWRSVPPEHSQRNLQLTCVEPTGGHEHRPAPTRLAISRLIAVRTTHQRKASPFHLTS